MAEHKESSLSIKDRLKNFLSLHKNQAGTSPVEEEHIEEQTINNEFWLEVSRTKPIENRIDKLVAFEQYFETKQLDYGIVEKLWVKTKDILNPTVPLEHRSRYFKFLQHLISCQYRNIGLLKSVLFATLSSHKYSYGDDIVNVLNIIDALSDHGKQLEFLEDEISSYLVLWMDIVGHNKIYLSLLLNVVKFNSAHLDEATIEGIVHHLCVHCSASTLVLEMESLLKVLDAIICYNSLPQSRVHEVVVTLCQALNHKNLCDQSWKIMRNLLGTHLGHSCVQTMCQMLQDVQAIEDGMVLRSAVFFLGMGLWGSKCVSTLMHKPQSILPCFAYALKMQNPAIGFEVSLTCQRLVKKFGHELHPLAWEQVLVIVEAILDTAASHSRNEQFKALQKTAHELLTLIEKLYQIQAFDGSHEDLFRVIEKYFAGRQTESVLLLLSYKAQLMNPSKENWMLNLLYLIEKFFVPTIETDIRLKVLDIVSDVLMKNCEVYEKDLIDTILAPTFQGVHTETNATVQQHSIKLITDFLQRSKTSQCTALLQCFKPFMQVSLTAANLFSKEAWSATEMPITQVVKGLVQFFEDKFYTSQGKYCIEAYEMLIEFLNSYYHSQLPSINAAFLWEARNETLNVLFKLRANFMQQLKVLNSVYFNPLITCHETDLVDGESAQHFSTVYLPFELALNCLIQCFEKENYWPVLNAALTSICDLTENKTIMLSGKVLNIRTLAEVVSNLVSSNPRVNTLSGVEKGFKREELQSAALRALTALSSFHDHMDNARQRQIIRCLDSGFATKCAKQCITSITLCMVEMSSDALLRVLPSILLHLSQMSATVHLATSVLELLSTLSQLPSLYANFVEDQYMSVFAIALEHATPAKFSLYVVSMAHHIIGMWFVKCRLSFRPDFVQFITRKLQNVNRNSMEDAFQHGLIESCIDVMARYTFSNSMPVSSCSKAKRTLKGGQSCTWLVGNRLITITTEGKTVSPVKHTSLEGSHDIPTHRGTYERRLSVEAPAKLQTTNTVSQKSSRMRHKSGGAVLRSKTISFLDEEDAPAPPNVESNSSVCLTEKDLSRAEICVRRPSGNTSFIMTSEQFTLTQWPSEGSNLHTQAPFLKSSSVDYDLAAHNGDVSHADMKVLNGEVDDHPVEVVRHRSHTVSSSQDYTQRAASRALTRSKQRTKAHTTELFDGVKSASATSVKTAQTTESVLTPGFVFLQLYQSAILANPLHSPVLLPNTATIERAVQVLDMIPPYDTWSTGVVYVCPGQKMDARSILSNEHGSNRYQDFLGSLGQLVSLKETDSSRTYLGGLDQSEGEDGLFTYVWQENIMQMVFHVTTLMPNHGDDISCKQRHIGNDYVTIVYDDSEKAHYVPGCVVKGQFLSAEIIVNPLDHGFNAVRVEYHKPEMNDILQITEKRIVSDKRLGLLVKQMALHANMAAVACRYQNKSQESVSKPFARLKQIKRIRTRVEQEMASKDDNSSSSSPAKTASATKPLCSLHEFSNYV
uniref:Tuberin-like n=1 Tax=Phallusia mammillata TaxID=59560 RepID=A0A6F9DCQ5_9ASCI|nr:tuberin-like [Phallusia mammillata]